MARKPKLPPGGRWTSAGRITLTIADINDGNRRKSQQKIKPDEPASYATADEAMAGLLRVKAFMAEARSTSTTVLGFWKDWTDHDHPRWGSLASRSPQSIDSYAMRTRRFVKMFGARQLDSITEEDVIAYLRAGGVHSSLRGIATLFHDAQRVGLIDSHPCAQIAGRAETLARKRRAERDGVVPEEEQILAMLDRAQQDAFPPSFYGWLLTGVRTGMRTGEIDGMEWKYLKGNRYQIRRQWNAQLKEMSGPKHGSKRDLLLPPDVMAEIDKQRDNGTPFIWINAGGGTCWKSDSRSYWWTWTNDGGPSLRQLVGGAQMKNATRHYWASWALNVAGIPPYQAALLYGHSDGGKLLTDTYAKPDLERAMQAAYDAAIEAQKVTPIRKRRAS
jgi:integrase